MTSPELQLPGYTLLRSLGRGNTSVVRLALNEHGEEVALKLPHPDTLKVHEAAERFGNEVRLTLQFHHPHLVRGFAGTPFGPQAFLALQYYPDGALSEQMARSGHRLTQPQAMQILADIASALTYLHKQGAVHQDVKTQNVYVDEQGRAALGDLGNTYFVAQGGKVSGSPYYMAPEIYHGESSSSASDVYSLGVLMYELLAGQRPFGGSTYEELMIAHLTRFASPLGQLAPSVPRPLARLAEQALAKRPHERPNAESIYRALAEALGQAPTANDSAAEVAPAVQRGRHTGTPATSGTASGQPAPRTTAGTQAPTGRSGATSTPASTPASKPDEQRGGWNPFRRRK